MSKVVFSIDKCTLQKYKTTIWGAANLMLLPKRLLMSLKI